MSVLDAPMRAVAKRLGRTFGKQGTIESVSTGGYNPSTGKASSGTSDEVTAYGVVEEYDASEIDGTTIRRGDVKWTIPAKGIARPRPNDLVTFDDEDAEGEVNRYTVVMVRSTYSGDEQALHELQLRR